MRARLCLAAAGLLLGLVACDKEEPPPAAAPPPAVVTAPAPAPPVATPQAIPITPQTSAEDRRRKLREDKDGEAQPISAPDYEGAASAATSLPSHADDGPASAPDTPSQASPPPPPPGQPPG